ncbi:MAG: hypothetical protein HY236_16810 [Acidobacteria bacterium]|nr:hypothetical protein [Acidobacteriota bacterium]
MNREEMQKVTVLLPRALVQKALSASGMGLTPTIRRGLETVAAAKAYERLRRRRGKVKFSINVDELRED